MAPLRTVQKRSSAKPGIGIGSSSNVVQPPCLSRLHHVFSASAQWSSILDSPWGIFLIRDSSDWHYEAFTCILCARQASERGGAAQPQLTTNPSLSRRLASDDCRKWLSFLVCAIGKH